MGGGGERGLQQHLPRPPVLFMRIVNAGDFWLLPTSDSRSVPQQQGLCPLRRGCT